MIGKCYNLKMRDVRNNKSTISNLLRIWPTAILGLFLIAILTNCTNSFPIPPTASNTLSELTLPTRSKTSTIQPAPATVPIITPENKPTQKPTQTRTAISTKIPTPTPIILATHTIQSLSRDGTAVPVDLDIINPEIILQLTELARWGKGTILTINYSPDETQVAVVTSQGIYFYDTYTAKLMQFISMKIKGPYALSPRLNYLAMESDQGVIEIWDLQKKSLFRRLFVSEHPILTIAFTPDEKQIFTSAESFSNKPSATSYRFDLYQEHSFESISFGAQQFVISADGERLARLYEGELAVWHRNDPDTQYTIQKGYPLSPIAMSQDGNYLAGIIENDEGIQVGVWRLDDLSLFRIFGLQIPPLTSSLLLPLRSPKIYAMPVNIPHQLSGPGRTWIHDLTFSPDGQKLFALNGFGLLHQWRLEDGKLLSIIPTDSRRITISPSGKEFAVWHYSAAFYNTSNGELINSLINHIGRISNLEFSPEGDTLMAGSYDGKVWWRKSENGNIIRSFNTHQKNLYYFTNSISDIDFSNDGSMITAGTHDGQVYLWSTSQKIIRSFEPSFCEWGYWITAVSLSHDNRFLAMQRAECPVEIFNLEENYSQVVDKLAGYVFSHFAFSPVSSWFAIRNNKGVDIINIPDMASIKHLGNIESNSPLCFSDDGQLLALSDYVNGNVEVWNVNESSLIFQFQFTPIDLQGGTSYARIERFAFSPDNRILAISIGSKVSFFDLSNGKEIGVVLATGEGLDFSPDGKMLAVGGYDGVISVYGVPLAIGSP